MAKLKRFFALRGIRLPSREKIKEKEQQLMVDYEINEAIGNIFFSIVFSNTFYEKLYTRPKV